MADDSSKNRDAHWRVYGGTSVKELIEAIAMGLVDKSDDVQVRVVEGKQVTVFELRVHPDDIGKVIGRKGRTAQSIRTLLGAMGMKERKRFVLDILEE
jgi:predicted RNA-binding protein YlqC (UPF0109 family)